MKRKETFIVDIYCGETDELHAHELTRQEDPVDAQHWAQPLLEKLIEEHGNKEYKIQITEWHSYQTGDGPCRTVWHVPDCPHNQ